MSLLRIKLQSTCGGRIVASNVGGGASRASGLLDEVERRPHDLLLGLRIDPRDGWLPASVGCGRHRRGYGRSLFHSLDQVLASRAKQGRPQRFLSPPVPRRGAPRRWRTQCLGHRNIPPRCGRNPLPPSGNGPVLRSCRDSPSCHVSPYFAESRPLSLKCTITYFRIANADATACEWLDLDVRTRVS